jgi:AAA family ATP:ADP antiporter
MTVRGRSERGKGARGEVVKQEPESSRAGDDSTPDPGRDDASRTGFGRPLGVLRGFADVREDEWNVLRHAGLFLFSLLAANYLIRPIRDEMGVAGGPENLPALFTGTLVSMLLAWPLLSAWLGRRGGRSSIGPILRVQQVMLLAFFGAFQVVPAVGFGWTARLFFVWASVTNLLIVSIAWGSLAGRFSSDQARRLFGLIAAGGALGGIVGSALAGVVGRFAGPAPLILPAVLFLEIGLRAGRRTLTPAGRSTENSEPAHEASAAPSRSNSGDGVYLVCLGLWTLLFTSTSAFVYLEQARIVEASIHDPAVRTAFFARIDLLVNVAGLAMQLVLTAWVLNTFGVGAAAAMLPAVTIVGMIALTLRPTVATVQWFQVARRAMDYAVARPSREVFYTVVDPNRLLRAKGLIDTAVYRAGDTAGAWTYGLLTAAPQMPAAAPAVAVVALSVVWIALSLGLGAAMTGRAACNRERNYTA